jgi:hypothetical protein
MKHTRVIIVALIVIVAATAAVASVVAASSSGSRDGAMATPATTTTPGATSTPGTTSTPRATGTTSTGGVATGIVGTLTLVNPGGPMIAAGGSPAPAPAIVVELLSPTTNAVIARARVGAGGGFRVSVPPGSYRVRVAPAAGGPSATVSHLVDVTDNGYARLVIGPVRGL